MSIHLTDRYLNLPLYVWLLQILYVAIALGLFALLVKTIKPNNLALFGTLYVIGMVLVNIGWRLLLQKTY